MREENWRSIGGHAKTSAFIFNKKLLHTVLVILKSDATDVNSLLTLSRPMPSKHSKVWSVFQWYLFQILFWDINLSGKPCLRWEEQQWHYEFSAHPPAERCGQFLPCIKSLRRSHALRWVVDPEEDQNTQNLPASWGWMSKQWENVVLGLFFIQ